MNTVSAIKLLVADLIEEPLLKIIHYLETESSLYSFFIEEKVKNKDDMIVDADEEFTLVGITSDIATDILLGSPADLVAGASADIPIVQLEKRKIWKEIFSKKDLNLIYPYNLLQSLIINPVFGLEFPFTKSDIYEISLGIKESIDKILQDQRKNKSIRMYSVFECLNQD